MVKKEITATTTITTTTTTTIPAAAANNNNNYCKHSGRNVTLRIAHFSAQSEGSDVRICEVLSGGPGHTNWNFCKTDECFIELIRR